MKEEKGNISYLRNALSSLKFLIKILQLWLRKMSKLRG